MTKLTETLENIALELYALEWSIEADATTPEFIKGDTLQIAHDYLGKKDTVEEVKYTSRKQCTIKDSKGAYHTCARTNFIIYTGCQLKKNPPTISSSKTK